VLSPDASLVALGGPNETTRLWRVADGKLIRVLSEKGSSGQCGAFSPDGKLFAEASTDVLLREVATGKEVGRFEAHKPWVYALAFSPDGRMLASAGGDREIRLWEVATGALRRCLEGHEAGYSRIQALAFAPDGRFLASGGEDTTILLWDVTAPGGSGKARTLAAAWDALADADATKAYEGLCRFIRAARQTPRFLDKRLQPVPRCEPVRIARLIAELDSSTFEIREKATSALAQLEEQAEVALQEAARSRSAEVRRRAARLLDRLRPGLPTGRLRAARAVEALEHIGSAEARMLLRKWANGAEGASLTREARAALARMDRPRPARR
jgi:hypothetical protein